MSSKIDHELNQYLFVRSNIVNILADAAIAERSGNELAYIIWHQGEADKDENPTDYQNALDNMIDDVRSRMTGASVTPFILGEPLQSGGLTDPNISAVIADTPNRKANTFFANSVGLVDGGDNIHFDAPSLRTYGQRYWDQVNA